MFCNVAGTVLTAGLMFLIGADVFGRQALNMPVSGVPELVALSIVAIVFLQVPQAFRSGRLTRSDALLNQLRQRLPRVAVILESAFDLIAVSILFALLYALWPFLLEDWEQGSYVGSVGNFTAPTWPVRLVMVVGVILLICQFLAHLFGLIFDLADGAAR